MDSVCRGRAGISGNLVEPEEQLITAQLVHEGQAGSFVSLWLSAVFSCPAGVPSNLHQASSHKETKHDWKSSEMVVTQM